MNVSAVNAPISKARTTSDTFVSVIGFPSVSCQRNPTASIQHVTHLHLFLSLTFTKARLYSAYLQEGGNIIISNTNCDKLGEGKKAGRVQCRTLYNLQYCNLFLLFETFER